MVRCAVEITSCLGTFIFEVRVTGQVTLRVIPLSPRVESLIRLPGCCSFSPLDSNLFFQSFTYSDNLAIYPPSLPKLDLTLLSTTVLYLIK